MSDIEQEVANSKYGHPTFYALLEQLGSLHSRKNHDYAKGGKPLGNFNRVAAMMQLYPGTDWSTPEMVAIVYMLKQFDAYMHMTAQGHISKTGEGKLERIRDICVYSGILFCIESDKISIRKENHAQACDRTPTPSFERVSLRDNKPFVGSIPAVEGQHSGERYPTTLSNSPERHDTERTPEVRSSAESSTTRSAGGDTRRRR